MQQEDDRTLGPGTVENKNKLTLCENEKTTRAELALLVRSQKHEWNDRILIKIDTTHENILNTL